MYEQRSLQKIIQKHNTKNGPNEKVTGMHEQERQQKQNKEKNSGIKCH